MSSSVFYKFKNSREPERIVFDGTDITVFELKREIITVSGLGDGTDFDLHLYPEDDPKAEYNDDTTTISRSSTVIAVRRPAARGHGRAARYVSGKAPVRAIKKDNKPTAPVTGSTLNEADAEAAFLAESAQVWDAQKATLSHAKPVFHKKKPVVVPTHDPPPGYVCRRCNIKGHWIQACPTNDDPDFKPVFQAKRTTGIPQSFLKKVEKPVDEEAAKGVMLNADGEYVQVMTDTKAWEKFQEKANASKAQAASADAFSREIRARGLECPIHKQKFVNPVKTPCCGKTYCHECIDNALADGDLVCPNCAKEDVLMDDLVPDEEMVKSIKAFDAEKAKEKLEKEEQAKAEAKVAEQPASPPKNETENSVPVETSTTASNDPSSLTVAATPVVSATPGASGNGSDTESTSSKKRKSPPTEIKPPTAPKAMRQQKEQEARLVANPAAQMEQDFIQQMEALKNTPLNMPMQMPMQMQMQMQMPMMNNNPNNPNNNHNNSNNNMPYQNMGFQMPFNNTNNNNPMNNMAFFNGGGGPGAAAMQMQMPMQMNMAAAAGQMPFNMGFMPQQQQHQHQQQQQHSTMMMHQQQHQHQQMHQQDWQQASNEAYDRQPVNPRQRHRKSRAPDYRYL